MFGFSFSQHDDIVLLKTKLYLKYFCQKLYRILVPYWHFNESNWISTCNQTDINRTTLVPVPCIHFYGLVSDFDNITFIVEFDIFSNNLHSDMFSKI